MAVIVGIDARTIFSERRRGTGKNLLDAYRVAATLRPDWQFIAYHRPGTTPDPFADIPNITSRIIELRGDRWDLWQQVRLPIAARRDRVRALHCPANSCPRFPAVPVVSTIHDLIPLRISDSDVPRQAENFRRQIRRCLEVSSRIITVSAATRGDLISDFGADPQRVEVIGWAADLSYARVRDEAELARVRSRYNIAGRYLLAFSGRSRRKNAEGMIRGFARMPAPARRVAQFVLIGVEPAEQRSRLTHVVQSLGLGDRCLVHGFAPESDIPALLSGSEALAFCSLYEGFGLPILDAFRCETAVLTSNVSSMPEVAGDAALYCDPTDPHSIAEGMGRLLTDGALRDRLIASGRERIRQFNWTRTAEALCRVLESCLTSQPTTCPMRPRAEPCGSTWGRTKSS